MNYFLMAPLYSFRVAQAGDIAALGIYAFGGMYVTLNQTGKARQGGALAFWQSQRYRPSLDPYGLALLDAYHFELLVRLCAEIGKMRGTSVGMEEVLSVALRRLEKTADSQGAYPEILQDVRLQLEYEEWVAMKLSKGPDGPN